MRVGLTGGVASGKSTVARLLAERGAAVCDADRVVAGLYEPGRLGARVVVDLFGAGVLHGSGGVDHRELGRQVLGDPEARARLEAAIHPLVRRELEHWFAGLQPPVDGEPLVAVVEAALLVETGEYRRYHRVVTVSASENVRRQRALRLGWDPGRFSATVAAQAEEERRCWASDYLVANEGSLEQLQGAVDSLWTFLREDAAVLRGGGMLPRRNRR